MVLHKHVGQILNVTAVMVDPNTGITLGASYVARYKLHGTTDKLSINAQLVHGLLDFHTEITLPEICIECDSVWQLWLQLNAYQHSTITLPALMCMLRETNIVI